VAKCGSTKLKMFNVLSAMLCSHSMHKTNYCSTCNSSLNFYKDHVTFVCIIKPTRRTKFSNLFLELKSTCFGQFLCPSSGVFHCTQQWYMSCRFVDSFRKAAGSGFFIKHFIFSIALCYYNLVTGTNKQSYSILN
jgi:hypothetical protein